MTRPALPPPHDLEAEEIVLAAALWGDVPADDLRLRPEHFWADEHRQIWEVLMSGPPELRSYSFDLDIRALVVAALVQIEHRRLLEILQTAPLWRSVPDCAATIRRLARQRQLLEAMARIGAAWRSGSEASPKLLRWTGRRLVRMAEEACDG